MLSIDASQPSAELVGLSRVAVLVPRYNEEAAIGKVVADFRAALPDATSYVYDNNPTDRTVEVAAKAGVLDTVTRGPRELKLLAYLAQRAPAEERRRS